LAGDKGGEAESIAETLRMTATSRAVVAFPEGRFSHESRRVVCPVMWPDAFDDRESFATACWEETIDAVCRARAELKPGWPYDVGPG
jgi:hypothetical protein